MRLWLCHGGDEIWALLTLLRPLEGATYNAHPDHVSERFVRAANIVLALPYLQRRDGDLGVIPS